MRARSSSHLNLSLSPSLSLSLPPSPHTSCHFTADILNINRPDFIITSTYQEIAGSAEKKKGKGAGTPSFGTSPGQYEAMTSFPMPGLFRVIDGVNVFDPRFNIISPGCDASIYFPFSEAGRRLTSLHPSLRKLIYGPEDGQTRGSLDPQGTGRPKPILFSMARLDRVKNLAGLATWFAASPRLQAACSLLIVGGSPDRAAAADGGKEADPEAASEAAALHALFDDPGRLPPGSARWVGSQTNPLRNGELYRLVADTGGAFCLPSLFENFGLTVVEAAASGLPVFVSSHGGCSEIIHDGQGGIHVDPYRGREAADKMAAFLEASAADPAFWAAASDAALARVAARYNWGTYAARLVTLSRVYSFWAAATRLDRAAAARQRYLDVLYQLILRPLMARVGMAAGEDGAGAPALSTEAADACKGVCAVALGALADPGAVAPAVRRELAKAEAEAGSAG